MEPIGLCGGGAVALALFLTAVVGSALLAGGVALALARLGVAVDARFKRRSQRELARSERASDVKAPDDGASSH